MTTTAPPPPTDDELRALLAPLAADDPTPRERAALRARLPTAAERDRRGWRPVLAVAATTAAVGAILALLPAGDEPQRGATGAGGHAAILRAAAAQAAGEVVPSVADAPYRYTKVRNTFTYTAVRDGRTARQVDHQESEAWVGAKWTGRETFAQGTAAHEGDEALARHQWGSVEQQTDTWLKPRDGAYAYGDGPLAELDPTELPSDRDRIAAVLRDGVANNRWASAPQRRGKPNAPGSAPIDSYLTYDMLYLLMNARVTPDQRAALLDVLSADPSAHDLGTVKDDLGRAGRGVSLHYPGGQFLSNANRFEVIFDPQSSELLQWSVAPERPLADSPQRTATIVASGYVAAIGDRP